jgi:hypothetical protein
LRFRTLTCTAGLIALVAVIPFSAAAKPKPGHNPGPKPQPGFSIGAAPTIVTFGSATAIRGRIAGAKAGTPVTLGEDAFPFGGAPKAVATSTTDGHGDYVFTRRPLVNTIYRATSGPDRSPNVLVNVRIRMSLAVSDATPHSGQLVRFRGRACPTHNGLGVAIQRRSSSGRYVTVRRTTLKPATTCSAYSRAFRIYRDGRYRVTADDADHARGYSPSRLVNAHR